MIFFKVFVFLLIWFVSLLGSGDIENFDDLVNFLWIWFVVLVLGVFFFFLSFKAILFFFLLFLIQ